MLAPRRPDRPAEPQFVEFVPLSSGSAGNATLIRTRDHAILVDAGLDRAELFDRLDSVRQRASRLDAVLVTHRHLDHSRSAATIARREKVTLYATERCLAHQDRNTIPDWQRITPGLAFRVADTFDVLPVRLSHDAPETCGFVVEAHGARMGIATDLGCSGGALTQTFRDLDVLYLEFNYDPEMLRTGTYSEELKRRIAGDRGHLSNAQAARILAQIKSPRLERLYLAHLSQHNNTRGLADEHARSVFSPQDLERVEILVAEQHSTTRSWRREVESESRER